MARLGTALARRPDDGAANAVGGRLADAFERRLARAVERRLAGAPSARRPGRLEQRVVAALQRRMAARSVRPRPAAAADGPWRRAGAALARRRPGARLPAESTTTLRALVVGIIARTLVRALVRLMRILSRGLVGGPLRRLAGVLVRRTLRARPRNQLRILALLLAAVLLAYRELLRRLAALPEAQRAAIMLGLRGLRHGLPAGVRLLGRLLRALAASVRRQAGRAVAARRAA